MPGPAESAGRRVVMLVANAVAGDSRVQKTAWSMAAAGWDVVLLGRAPGAQAVEYRLGAARVLLVPVGDAVSGYQRGRSGPVAGSVARRAAYRAARARLAAWDRQDRRITREWTGGSSRRTRPGRPTAPAHAGPDVPDRHPSPRRWLAAHPAADRLLVPLGSGRVAGPPRTALTLLAGLLGRGGGWRALHPRFRDLELAFAPVIEMLEPDLIHAHDHHTVGVGARAAARLSAAGRRVRWVYDAHEYLAGVDVPRPGDLRARMRRRMLLGLEREFAGRADAVVTVSEPIARRLRADHRLRRDPLVVLNAPVVRSVGRGAARVPDVRRAAGLASSEPLLLYSGGLAERRGVDTVVGALPDLPGVHLVCVARRDDPDAARITALARRLAVRGRVHLVDYVTPDLVVPYIASATAGLVPLVHRPNHELSLITKYLEYLHARLPILCSDVREMARCTATLGVGEVFRAGDAASFAAAARRLLADPGRYRARYRRPEVAHRLAGPLGWDRQAAALDALYAELTGARPCRGARTALRLLPVEYPAGTR